MQDENKPVTKKELDETLARALSEAIGASEERILAAMAEYSMSVNERFDRLETDVFGLKSDVTGLKSDVSGLKSDVTGLTHGYASLKEDVVYLKNNMVTKDYLDNKLVDLRADLVVLTRKEDSKVNALVEALVEQKSLRPETGRQILAMEPFAR